MLLPVTALLLHTQLQQVGSQQWYKKSVTILAAFAVPLVLALLSRGVLWTMRFGETRDERFLRKLMDAKRKMIKDLKVRGRVDVWVQRRDGLEGNDPAKGNLCLLSCGAGLQATSRKDAVGRACQTAFQLH